MPQKLPGRGYGKTGNFKTYFMKKFQKLSREEMKNILVVEGITDPSSAMYSNLKLTNDGLRDAQIGVMKFSRGKN